MEKSKKLLVVGVLLLFGSYYLYNKRKSRMNVGMSDDLSYDTKEKKNRKGLNDRNKSISMDGGEMNQNKGLTEPPMRVSDFSGGEDFFNFDSSGQYVVGGYNPNTNQTWIYPEGNIGGGHYVMGYVDAPQGTTFTPNS
jgi:hypothetical protein